MNGTNTSATLRVLGLDLAFSSAGRYHVEWSGQDPRGNLEIVATLSHGTTRPRPEGAWAVRLTHIEAHRSFALKAHAHSIGEAEAQILVPLRGAIDLAEPLFPRTVRSRAANNHARDRSARSRRHPRAPRRSPRAAALRDVI